MNAPTSRSLVVVTAGLSEPSSSRLLGDRLAAAVERHLQEAGLDLRLEVVELRAHAVDLANQMLTGFPSPGLQAALDAVVAADGVVAVTPIFSGSYNGLFKMFFDAIDRDGFRAKPVLIAATGGSPRHSLAIEHAVRPGSVATDGSLVERIDRAATELASAMVARSSTAPADGSADPVPFGDLLRGSTGRTG